MTAKKLKAFARVEKNQDKKSMEILVSFSTVTYQCQRKNISEKTLGFRNLQEKLKKPTFRGVMISPVLPLPVGI